MHNGKAQTEIIGLVLIVILIALGMLFALQFVLRKPNITQAQSIKESTLAANFLNTLLSTTTDCNNRNVKELLQDCALSGVIQCPIGNSCDYARQTITQVIEKTLDGWNKKYSLTVRDGQELNGFTFSNAACTGEREAKIHPVPVTAGYQITLRLEICT